METILNHPWLISMWTFIQSHPTLWFVLFILVFLLSFVNWLANLIPQLDILRAKVLMPIAKSYKHSQLVKKAIKSDIRGHVNLEISKMKAYLPAGWATEMDVDWVKNEELSDLLQENKIIVRIRPVENQDHNFVNTVYHYLRTSFFPKTQAVVPKPHFEASVLHVCRKIAENRGGESKTVFEEQILEPSIQRHKQIPTYLDDYSHLDERGFFTGTFLRELHLVATEARFTSARANMGQEAIGIINHIKKFITAFQSEDKKIPATCWSNKGNVSKYAILLVANPVKTAKGIDAYINRARSQFQSGAKRLYVFGSNTEAKFANSVIVGIEGTIDNIKLIERYETPFDYRGAKQGIGAVFEMS